MTTSLFFDLNCGFDIEEAVKDFEAGIASLTSGVVIEFQSEEDAEAFQRAHGRGVVMHDGGRRVN